VEARAGLWQVPQSIQVPQSGYVTYFGQIAMTTNAVCLLHSY
jgi:hypothetical protein